MDFSYSEEQTLIANSLRKLLDDTYAQDQRQRYLESDLGYSADNWRQYAELGLLSVPFAEEVGGFGGSSVDVLVLQTEFGRRLALEPFVSTVVLGGGAVRLAASAEQQAEILPAVIAGECRLAAALGEPQARFDLNDVETTARADGGGWVLNGAKAVVMGGDTADKLVVSARTGGAATEREGLSLFLVDADAAGVSRRGYRLIDGRGAAEVTLDNVTVDGAALLGEPGAAWPVIEHVADLGNAALCAEAVGAMEMVNELTLDYLKMRQQFGRPIGRFQVLQHRMVDLVMEYENARSIALLAAMEADNPDVTTRARAVSAAKVYVAGAGRKMGQWSIQMHGGIGMTDEYMLGHYAKRLNVGEQTLGDVDHHLARFGAIAAAA
ncbi:MAG: acyl-CoA dehydrogenase family protein [Hyphomicrobiales bacterium]|nr:acyl-CoA dehydrogenase family protein [Hyphomicrobiales bacterium]MCP5374108.1 acyl-CoA dehydrogenase family protein [Hyphomicrobiales bacterium]